MRIPVRRDKSGYITLPDGYRWAVRVKPGDIVVLWNPPGGRCARVWREVTTVEDAGVLTDVVVRERGNRVIMTTLSGVAAAARKVDHD